jgi:hypothetical protein
MPTETEWQTEKSSWYANTYNGAFDSPLKLTAGGYRVAGTASLSNAGTYGAYWGSNVSGTNAIRIRFMGTPMGDVSGSYRASGYSVRCIKD